MDSVRVEWAGSSYGRGLNPRKHFAAPPPANHLGAHLATASFPDVYGSWGMLNSVGGIGNQFQTSRCFPFATKKAFGLYQFGQSGTPVEYSADWIYALVLSEIRRVELGGSPTEAQMLANPFQDNGSEPSAGFDAARRIGIAPEAAWPTGPTFRATEMDLGGAIAGQLWKPEAAGFTSIVATPGPALTQAALAALMPFSDGKLGQSIQVSIASSATGFDGADGTRPMLVSDFNGANYDHAVVGALGTMTSAVYEQCLGRQLTAAETAESPTSRWFILANSWDQTQWGQFTKLPEIVNGKPTGSVISFPGCCVVSEMSFWGFADWSTVAETVPEAA